MKNNLTYTQNGDYLIPDLSLSEQPEKPLGKYGRMRKAYLKEHRALIYNHVLLTEKLYPPACWRSTRRRTAVWSR